MGCFLTTTTNDLKQIKSRMRSGNQNSQPPPAPSQFIQNTMDLYSISPVLGLAYIKKEKGAATYNIGKLGESIAEKILEQEMNLTITQRTKSQGQDLGGTTFGGQSVSVEVKTTTTGMPFEKLLKSGYGHKQCSNGWLHAVGIDPANTKVLGVHIDTSTNTVSIYRRVDENADVWKCLVRNAPLSNYDF